MKKFLLGSIALAATSLAAQAADFPAKAPVYTKAPIAVWSWTGFYVGGNVGGAWGRSNFSSAFTNATGFYAPADLVVVNQQGIGSARGRSVTGGAQLGYNRQIGAAVLGAEADFDSLRLKDVRPYAVQYVTNPAAIESLTQQTTTNWLATLRGRIGYSFGNALIYGTGGVGFTNIAFLHTMTSNPALPGADFRRETASASAQKTGWVAGGGVEYALGSQWSIRGEYLHLDFGNVNASALIVNNAGSFPMYIHSAKFTADIVRAGIDYKFGGPVVAGY